MNHASQVVHHERWVMVAAVLASSMAFIDVTALNVALPAIQADLEASGTELLWIVNSYALLTAAMILFGGMLGDRFGRANVFGLGIGIFGFASLGCGWAPDTRMLILARSVQGIGAALMIPGSLSLIATMFDPLRRGRAIGIWSACSVVMTAIGPIIGGFLADANWWRGVFFLNVPLALIALVIVVGKIPAVPRQQRPLDFFGAGLAILWLGSLNYVLLERVAGQCGGINAAFAAFVCLASFLGLGWHGAKSRFPLLPPELIRNRTFLAASQLTLCFYGSLYGILFLVALNLVQVQHYPATVAGMAQLPVMVFVVLLSPLAGIMVDRFGPRLPLGVGGLLGVIGFLLMAWPGVTLGPSEYWTTFFPAFSLIGIALGLSAAPLSTTVMNCVSNEQLGLAAGINSTLSRLSGVLGVAILGAIAMHWFRELALGNAAGMNLDRAILGSIDEQTRNFAHAAAPSGLSGTFAASVQDTFRNSFVACFRVASWAAAAALACSTIVTLRLLSRGYTK